MDKQISEIANAKAQHQGFYNRFKNSRIPEIEKSIRSLEKQIAVHKQKISTPRQFVRNDTSEREIEHLVCSYWPKEILRFSQQIAVLKELIAERREK